MTVFINQNRGRRYPGLRSFATQAKKKIGLEGEVNCYNPEFDPSTLRDEDEVIDPDWLVLTKRALQSGADTDRR